jgi:hypothetical protein
VLFLTGGGREVSVAKKTGGHHHLRLSDLKKGGITRTENYVLNDEEEGGQIITHMRKTPKI